MHCKHSILIMLPLLAACGQLAESRLTRITGKARFEKPNLPPELLTTSHKTSSGITSSSFHLQSGERICDAEVKELHLGDETAYFGQYPAGLDLSGDSSPEFPSNELALEYLHAVVPSDLIQDLSIEGPCLLLLDEPTPVVRLRYSSSNNSELVDISSAGIVRRVPNIFHAVDGVFSVYDPNPLSGSLKTGLTETVDSPGTSGSIANDHFIVYSSNIGSNSPNFSFDPGAVSNDFNSASAFYNANKMLRWYYGRGFEDYFDYTRITISVGDITYTDNAVYIPPVSTSMPARIVIGASSSFQQLPRDFDVIAHELGHHIVYKGIRDLASNESLVLHEGMADYFVNAFSGNPCLAASICTKGAPYCVNGAFEENPLNGMCLRTASNDLVIGDKRTGKDAHVIGMVISAYLWDIHQAAGTAPDFPRLLIDTIDLLPSSAGYEDLVYGLMLMDRKKNTGLCQTILDGAVARKLMPSSSTPYCSSAAFSDATNIDEYKVIAQNEAAGIPAESRKKGGSVGCGMISGHAGSVAGKWASIINMLPLVIGLIVALARAR